MHRRPDEFLTPWPVRIQSTFKKYRALLRKRLSKTTYFFLNFNTDIFDTEAVIDKANMASLRAHFVSGYYHQD
jgi:hypothetical protein